MFKTEYTSLLSAMDPMVPNDEDGVLEQKCIELLEKTQQLSSLLHPITRQALSEMLMLVDVQQMMQVLNKPIDIADVYKAKNKVFSTQSTKLKLQIESLSIMNTISLMQKANELPFSDQPSSKWYVQSLHKKYYDLIPEDFRIRYNKEGIPIKIKPGLFRHVDLDSSKIQSAKASRIESFLERFELAYHQDEHRNRSKIHRISAIPASYHRLSWIQPFQDGNEIVELLYMQACIHYEGLNKYFLWSLSHAIAKNQDEFLRKRALADKPRFDESDGRGNLSDKKLFEFCMFFLDIAIREVDMMRNALAQDAVHSKITRFANWQSLEHQLKPAAIYILQDLFVKGSISKQDAMRITNTSDKTLKLMIDELEKMKLLSITKHGRNVQYVVKFSDDYLKMLLPEMQWQ